MKYRKKPVVIEAFKWTGDENQTEDPQWIVDAIKNGTVHIYGSGHSLHMGLRTREGNIAAIPGDYVIRNEQGEIYPCKPDIFERTYEDAESVPPQNGCCLIAVERAQQVIDKGWTPEHDDSHQRGELVDAALSYIRAAVNVGHPAMKNPPAEWPWDAESWNPSFSNRVLNLIKAGALIAAEIDRLLRLKS